MPGRQTAIEQHIAYLIRQFQQPQAVCHMRTALADNLPEIVLSVSMLGDQLFVTKRLFDRIEVGSLDIFDNRQLERCPVIDIADNHGNLDKSRQLRRTPTAFTGNDLVFVARQRPHDDGLDDTMLSNRARQILQFGLGKILARILRITADQLDRLFAIGTDARPAGHGSDRLVHFPDEGGKAAAKAAL
jgi:hypothetical protein